MGGLLIVLTTFLPVFDRWSASRPKKTFGIPDIDRSPDLQAGGSQRSLALRAELVRELNTNGGEQAMDAEMTWNDEDFLLGREKG